ncbi:MAG: hypothetical protein M0P17_06285 [Methanoculleus sp.]|nr:hypothetical protein [Methanoculleus sp.]
MKEKRVMNGTGRGGLICIALLAFILAGSSIACASPGEDVQFNPTDGEAPPADAGNGREAVLEEPAGTVAYRGSESAFSVFYNPMLLGCGLGAVIVFSVGYFLIWRYRGKGAP